MGCIKLNARILVIDTANKERQLKPHQPIQFAALLRLARLWVVVVENLIDRVSLELNVKRRVSILKNANWRSEQRPYSVGSNVVWTRHRCNNGELPN